MYHLGIMAALGTAITWAACGVFFTSASRRIGVFSMNHHRVLWGFVALFIIHFVSRETLIPTVGRNDLFLLLGSGTLGIFIGDTFLFQSYMDVGPRLGMLVFNLYPMLTAFIAWPILGERLRGVAWFGIVITLLGTMWVVIDENRNTSIPKGEHHIRGVIFAVIAAICQAFSLIMAKPVMTGFDGVDPLSATLIRVFAGFVCFWTVGFMRGHTKKVISDLKNTPAMLYMSAGVIFGPTIGIWLSMIAVKMIPAGIAATLMATMPIMVIPMVMFAYKEKVTYRAAIGALIAVVGIAILFNLN